MIEWLIEWLNDWMIDCLLLQTISRKWYSAYQIVANLLTFSDLKDCINLFTWDFLCSYALVYTFSTNVERQVVPQFIVTIYTNLTSRHIKVLKGTLTWEKSFIVCYPFLIGQWTREKKTLHCATVASWCNCSGCSGSYFSSCHSSVSPCERCICRFTRSLESSSSAVALSQRWQDLPRSWSGICKS